VRGQTNQIVISLSIFASQRDDLSGVSQLIEMIGPSLHHPDALRPVFGCVHVSAPNIVRFLVCKLTLDGIWIQQPISFNRVDAMPLKP
jgi:hypothetical protein